MKALNLGDVSSDIDQEIMDGLIHMFDHERMVKDHFRYSIYLLVKLRLWGRH